MTYKIEIKGPDKDVATEIEDLKELKKLLEEYTSTDEVKVEKVIKIKMQVIFMEEVFKAIIMFISIPLFVIYAIIEIAIIIKIWFDD